VFACFPPRRRQQREGRPEEKKRSRSHLRQGRRLSRHRGGAVARLPPQGDSLLRSQCSPTRILFERKKAKANRHSRAAVSAPKFDAPWHMPTLIYNPKFSNDSGPADTTIRRHKKKKKNTGIWHFILIESGGASWATRRIMPPATAPEGGNIADGLGVDRQGPTINIR